MQVASGLQNSSGPDSNVSWFAQLWSGLEPWGTKKQQIWTSIPRKEPLWITRGHCIFSYFFPFKIQCTLIFNTCHILYAGELAFPYIFHVRNALPLNQTGLVPVMAIKKATCARATKCLGTKACLHRPYLFPPAHLHMKLILHRNETACISLLFKTKTPFGCVGLCYTEILILSFVIRDTL